MADSSSVNHSDAGMSSRKGGGGEGGEELGGVLTPVQEVDGHEVPVGNGVLNQRDRA